MIQFFDTITIKHKLELHVDVNDIRMRVAATLGKKKVNVSPNVT